ncbi:unnamed protein product [Effrenium voratum]|nr:unnamed protein product [Effrenium voratum]
MSNAGHVPAENFDVPSDSLDGNVSARWQFAARRWRYANYNWSLKHTWPSSLDEFVRQWGLESWALQVVKALPREVQQEVLHGFDGSSTRDGNISRRFLGYVRSKWGQHYELDEDCLFAMKKMPEEGQVLCLTTFDPSLTRDGNISARLRSFLWKVEAQIKEGDRGYKGRTGYDRFNGYHKYTKYTYEAEAYNYNKMSSGYCPEHRDAILKFVSQWNLDLAVGAYLESLKDPDVVARVLEEFDPVGTQDGNVLSRLKAFVRLLCSRRKRGELEEYPRRRTHKKEKWQKKDEVRAASGE